MCKPIIQSIDHVIRSIFLGMIKIYQYVISPYVGSACRFYPTCSRYAETAFSRFNVVKAIYLTLSRLLKCHPFDSGGIDQVPKNYKKLT